MTHWIAHNLLVNNSNPSIDYIKDEPLGGFEAEAEDRNRLVKLPDNMKMWTCVLCKKIPLDPCCIDCGHLVCWICSYQVKTCPLDGYRVEALCYNWDWGKFEQRLYRQIVVTCVFNCGYQSELGEIKNHLRLCTKKPSNVLVESINSIESNCLVSLPTESDLIICPICFGVPRDMVVLTSCGHLHCNECCVRQSIKSGIGPLRCALCRTVYTYCEYRRLSELTPWVRKILRNIIVKCSYNCGDEKKIELMPIHEGSLCANRPVYCSHKGCNAKMKYEELKEHEKTCPKKRVHCPKCLLPILVGEAHNCIKMLKKIANALRKRVLIGDRALPYWSEDGEGGTIQKRNTVEDYINFVRGLEGDNIEQDFSG